MPTIRPRGDKFQAIVRVKRLGKIVHQESKVFAKRALAVDWAERLEARLAADGLPSRKLATKTLGALLQDYLGQLELNGVVRRTRTGEIMQLARDFHTVTLGSLSAHTFSEYATRRRKEGAGPATVLHNLATLRSVLNAAKPMFGLEVDGRPVSEAIKAMGRVGTVGRSDSRERRPTKEELERIGIEYQRIAAYPSTVIPGALIVRLAVALPRRLGELLDMRWEDYNKKTRIIKLRDTKHPTKPRDETVPVPPEAAAIINSLPVTDERMLPYKSESMSASFERVTARLGIADLRFHDLRHEGITRLFESGLSIHEVALISGHESWAMLRRYTHPSATALSEKMNAGQ